jgi:hypothetical protein
MRKVIALDVQVVSNRLVDQVAAVAIERLCKSIQGGHLVGGQANTDELLLHAAYITA